MSVFKDMAHDAGYRGDEAEQVARKLEECEREQAELAAMEADAAMETEERIRETLTDLDLF